MTSFASSSGHENAEVINVALVNRTRAALIHAGLVLFALAIIAKAIQVQILDGRFWSEKAARQHIAESSLPAPRGPILDERGFVLAESRELVQLSIAPREVRHSPKQDDRPVLARELKGLGVSREVIRSVMDTNTKWISIPKYFGTRDAQTILELRRGIHPVYVMQRQVSASDGLKRVIGVLDNTDQAVGGIEQALDDQLRGETGMQSKLRDGRGNTFDTPSLRGYDATPGRTVKLTINSTLQEITERELALALQRTGASGGDVIIIDPRDGSVLASAGLRNGKTPLGNTPISEGYEAGSVLKPFVVSRLLDLGKVTPDEVVNTEGGKFKYKGRSIEDEHKRDFMPVRDVIRFSSNIGIVKLATNNFTQSQEYEMLRDFGFGVQPGTSYPAEFRGRVALPKTWSNQTAASLAMGYEIAVSPLQLAMAYASVANGGELLEPALVREIRDPDGNIVYQHERRVLRRVMKPDAAEKMRAILESVVDSGTATAAELKTFDVAGKSGTARRVDHGKYREGLYNATFAGMFPAKKPQYVIVARLIDPQGKIFGGLVSAPVVNRILQQAVATRDVQLDRGALAEAAHPAPALIDSAAIKAAAKAKALALKSPAKVSTVPLVLDTGVLEVRVAPTVKLPPTTSVLIALPFVNTPVPAPLAEPRVVPNVHGLDLRDAVRTLQAAGFQVQLSEKKTGHTTPAAGSLAKPGSTVLLETAR
ncbi:MAG: penicillin-binding transpeptidase domain-containing protein [Gemmatimonadaceae bacterium]